LVTAALLPNRISPTLLGVSVTCSKVMLATSDQRASAFFAAVCCAAVNGWKVWNGSWP